MLLPGGLFLGICGVVYRNCRGFGSQVSNCAMFFCFSLFLLLISHSGWAGLGLGSVG